MASEACGRCELTERELGTVAEPKQEQTMISAQSTTNLARVFMVAENVHGGGELRRLGAARVQAEKLLNEYFAFVEREVSAREE
jgi:hypothetical protein